MMGEMQATGLQQVIYSVLMLTLLLLQLPSDKPDSSSSGGRQGWPRRGEAWTHA